MASDAFAEIEKAYRDARERALARWSASGDAGAEVALPYDESALALTIGSRFAPPAALRPVIDEIAALAVDDARIVPVPASALHFTFLAVTPHRWPDVAAVPDPGAFKACVDRALAGLSFELHALRLLPGPNALLLAGLPTAAMLVARDALIADLRAAGAGASLAERYGAVFPPVFWHTTLARSRTALCPPALRAVYARYDAVAFGTLGLAPPRLRLANFDWTRGHEID